MDIKWIRYGVSFLIVGIVGLFLFLFGLSTGEEWEDSKQLARQTETLGQLSNDTDSGNTEMKDTDSVNAKTDSGMKGKEALNAERDSGMKGADSENMERDSGTKDSGGVNSKSDSGETEKTGGNPAAETAAMERESQRILSLSAGELAAEGIVPYEWLQTMFFAEEIGDSVFARINGLSYTENDAISLGELSYLRMLHYGLDGNTYVGEMIVNHKIAEKVLEIFRTLYENQYPIERMVLIDAYGAEDEASMNDNNTSAFNYRTISGSSKLSNHSYGLAVDLNPKYNPYVKTASDGSVFCQPESGIAYADRSKEFAYKIDTEDLAYQLFTQAGFIWGGSWKSVKDYQHFEFPQT